LQFENAAMEVGAAHARHDHVGDEDIDRARVVLGDFRGILRRKCIEHDEARFAQEFTDSVYQCCFVVHQQDCGGRRWSSAGQSRRAGKTTCGSGMAGK
jgi:hypothetical protein